MANLDAVTLHIKDSAERLRGHLTIRVLPTGRREPESIWPLVDEREDPDRDTSLEPVQLLEGQEYLYEIALQEPASTVTTDRETMFYPDAAAGSRGRLRTGLYTGAVRVAFQADGRELGCVAFEVRSRKVDYMSQYRWMLKDIAEGVDELIMHSFAPAAQRFTVDDERDAATLYQRFAFLESLVMDEVLEDAITHIINRPHREWVETKEWRHPSQPIPASSRVARQVARPGPRILSDARSGTIPYPLPAKLAVGRTRETLDTEPNRFVQFALQQWRQVVEQLGDALQGSRGLGSRAEREVQAVLDHLDRYLLLTGFPELSRLTRFPAGNLVLHRREGYRTIFQLYLQFEMAARLSWEGSDDVYHAGQRDVATLYEYWVYFQLANIVARLAEVSLDYGRLIQPSRDGVMIGLKKGRQRVVKGTLHRLGRKLQIEFWFNRTFRANQTADGDGSWTRTMRPDFSLKITPESGAGTAYADTWVHFDAKYRVDTVVELFGVRPTGAIGEEEEGSLGDEEEVETGRPLRGDLLKMHAYRDAIRRSSGAYVIYPGSEQELETEYHEILPGLGAFALRPTKDGMAAGTGRLTEFIEDVMTHVASQVTQHERQRFWVHTVHTDEQPAKPTRMAPFLTKPPADTLVLLGYVKSEAHLAWIRRTGRYNLRADGRTGSVGLQGEELGVDLVVLYGPPLGVAELWRVVDGPQVMTRQRMAALDYPTPRGELYICLPIEQLDSTAWQRVLDRSAVERVRDREADGAAHGAPVVTTWFRVVGEAQ